MCIRDRQNSPQLLVWGHRVATGEMHGEYRAPLQTTPSHAGLIKENNYRNFVPSENALHVDALGYPYTAIEPHSPSDWKRHTETCKPHGGSRTGCEADGEGELAQGADAQLELLRDQLFCSCRVRQCLHACTSHVCSPVSYTHLTLPTILLV